MHLGHLIPFLFTKCAHGCDAPHADRGRYLQDAFKVPLVVQMTDDEKYLFKDLTLPELNTLVPTFAFLSRHAPQHAAGEHQGHHCVRLRCQPHIHLFRHWLHGWCVHVGLIAIDCGAAGKFYENILRFQKCVTLNQAKHVFGFGESDNIGQHACALDPSNTVSRQDCLRGCAGGAVVPNVCRSVSAARLLTRRADPFRFC